MNNADDRKPRSVFRFWLGLLSLILMLLWPAALFAEDAASGAKPQTKTAPSDGQDSEVDISDVQNQYWKSHDKEFEVIQNKQYTKSGRVELTPQFGLYQRVDFQDTKTLGLSAAYHFSDMWGAEVTGYRMFNSDSLVLTQFQTTRNATIEFNQEKYYLGVSGLFTPIYGKFSFLGTKISHFDLYLAPGLGVTRTVSDRFTTKLGVGQKFWLNPHWNIRVEYDWMRYQDRVDTQQGATAVKNGGPGYFDETVNDQNLLFGISYLF